MAKCEKCGNPWPYHYPGSTTCLEIQIDGLQQRLDKAEARAAAAEAVRDVAIGQISEQGRLRGMAEAKVAQLTRYIAKSCSPKCVPGRDNLCDDCPINIASPPSVDKLVGSDRPVTNGSVTFRYGPLTSGRR